MKQSVFNDTMISHYIECAFCGNKEPHQHATCQTTFVCSCCDRLANVVLYIIPIGCLIQTSILQEIETLHSNLRATWVPKSKILISVDDINSKPMPQKFKRTEQLRPNTAAAKRNTKFINSKKKGK